MNEKTTGRIFLYCIIVYILWYGIFISHGFNLNRFEAFYVSMLLPIFLIDTLKTIIESHFCGKFYVGREELEKVTVVIPTKNGGKELKNTLVDLLKRFKPKQIIVASNGSTDDTCKTAQSYGVIVIDHPDAIGKVSAINLALKLVQTEYVLILDDDTLLGRAIIPTQALDDGYDAVAFRVYPVDRNWVTKIQGHEYRKSMDIGRCFHNNFATVPNISGAIGLFRTKELVRQSEIHTGEWSGEDLQRTLLIHLFDNVGGVVISESTIKTEVPTKVIDLYNQRVFGWNPGLMSNLSIYLKLLLRHHATPFVLRYEAFYNSVLVVLLDPIRLIVLPTLIYYPQYFLILYFVYVLAETIPYLVMKKKEPYWVVLIYPLYGIFNFITRIVSMAIFLYRRLVVYIGSGTHLDDYKNRAFVDRFISFALVILFGLIILSVSMIVRNDRMHSNYHVVPNIYTNDLQFTAESRIKFVQDTLKEPIVAEPEIEEEKLAVVNITTDYIIQLEKGDGKIRIARKAVNRYCAESGIELNNNQNLIAENTVSKFIDDLPKYKQGIYIKIPKIVVMEVVNNIK